MMISYLVSRLQNRCSFSISHSWNEVITYISNWIRLNELKIFRSFLGFRRKPNLSFVFKMALKKNASPCYPFFYSKHRVSQISNNPSWWTLLHMNLHLHPFHWVPQNMLWFHLGRCLREYSGHLEVPCHLSTCFCAKIRHQSTLTRHRSLPNLPGFFLGPRTRRTVIKLYTVYLVLMILLYIYGCVGNVFN